MGTLTLKIAKGGGKTRHTNQLPVRRGNTLDITTVTTSGTSNKADVALNPADAQDDAIYTVTTDTPVYIKVGNDTGLAASSADYPLATTDELEISLEPGENIAVIDQ